MANQSIVLCDTNILIEFYKNNSSVISDLKEIGQLNIAISIVTAGELLYGAFNKQELNQILKDIAHLKLLHLNQDIGSIQLQLMADFSLSHNLNLPDAMIAATAIYYNYPIFTLNKKDFHYIPGIRLYSRT